MLAGSEDAKRWSVYVHCQDGTRHASIPDTFVAYPGCPEHEGEIAWPVELFQVEEIMKRTGTCPKCGKDEILHIEHAMSSNRTGPDGLVDYWGQQLAGAVLGLKMGQLEAFVCRECGNFELSVRDPRSLVVDGNAIREYVRK